MAFNLKRGVLALFATAYLGLASASLHAEDTARKPVKKQNIEQKVEQAISFEDARKDPSKRDAYIEELEKKIETPDYVDIQYVNQSRLNEMISYTKDVLKHDVSFLGNEKAITVPDLKKGHTLFNKNSNPKVLVFDYMFNNNSTKNNTDVMTTLKYHELVHADFFYKGPKDSKIDPAKLREIYRDTVNKNPSLFKTYTELEATHNEIKNISPENSPEHQKNARNYYVNNYSALWKMKDHPTTVNDLKMMYCPNWLEKDNYGKDKKGSYLIDNKKKKLYLPEGVTLDLKK